VPVADPESLAVDIDLRLRGLWDLIAELAGEERLDAVMALVRAAYGFGYVDAIKEVDANERGKLCLEHGFAVP